MKRRGAPRVLRTVVEMREAVSDLRRDARTLGFVPTMGALHEGHLALVDRATDIDDAVCVSVFVNPTQFGPGEDLDRYPRDLEGDVRAVGARGAELVFAPEVEEMYPAPQTIWVDPGPLADRLCGRARPGHFRGVLTVVLKLFAIVEPDTAVFGRKDFQQSVLVRKMVEEFRLGVRIDVAPTVRDPDGLALSSRNAYLSPGERESALGLSVALRRVRRGFAEGEKRSARLVDLATESLEQAGAEPEYVAIVDPHTLDPVDRAGPDDVCALAAHVGGTRLIDNADLGGPHGP